MIDNIYKAIIHAREVAKNWRSQLVNCVSEEGRCECQERAAEHELIADWIEELTERREVVDRLEEVAKDYKDSLFGDGIRFALKIIREPRKRGWVGEENPGE